MVALTSRRTIYCLLLAVALASIAAADTITVTGAITQSTEDGTGPASNSPDLNKIEDGDLYAVTLTFPGSITPPGTFPLSSFSLVFEDLTNPAIENGFDSVSVSLIPDGSMYDVSMFGCLSSGDCGSGNSLSAFFQIPQAGINSQNVDAQALFGITPLDLLEDGGVTDIQGSVSKYSHVPEPSQLAWLLLAAGAMGCACRKHNSIT